MENNTVGANLQSIIAEKGKYIRFGGQGIIDGLKTGKAKTYFYKIIGFEEGSKTSCGGLIICGYCARNYSILPIHCFNQSFEVITEKEYKKLPKY